MDARTTDDDRLPLLDMALGTAAVGWRAGALLWGVSAAAARRIGAAVTVVAPTGAAAMAERGRSVRVAAEQLADEALRYAIRRVAAAFLAAVDMTALVRDHVDLDAVAAGIDVDAIVARVDLDGVIATVDLDAVARRIDLDTLASRLDLDRIVERVDLDAAARRLDLDALAARVDPAPVVARVDLDAIIARLDLEALARQVIEAVDLPEIVRHSTGALTSDTVRTVRTEARHADDAVTGFVDRMLRRGTRLPAGSPAVP